MRISEYVCRMDMSGNADIVWKIAFVELLSFRLSLGFFQNRQRHACNLDFFRQFKRLMFWIGTLGLQEFLAVLLDKPFESCKTIHIWNDGRDYVTYLRHNRQVTGLSS